MLAHKQEDGSWCGGDLPPEDNTADADYDEGAGEDEDGDQGNLTKQNILLDKNFNKYNYNAVANCQHFKGDF